MSLIPATILTGFLGSGKTTLLKRVLTEAHGQKIAVIENEFGDENIDNEILVQDSKEQIIQLNNGCVCCSIREDLRTTLSDLAEKKRKGELDFERVVIETTGLADPAPVMQTLMTDTMLQAQYRLDCVVTLVDAVNGVGQLDTMQEAVKQAALADRIVVTKSDLVTSEAARSAMAELTARLRTLNPAAAILDAAKGEARAARLLDCGLYDPASKIPDVTRWLAEEAYAEAARHRDHGHDHEAGHHHDHVHDVNRHDDRIRAFSFATDAPIPASLFDMFIELLRSMHGPNMLRLKGVVKIAEMPDTPIVVHGVQHLFHPTVRLERWPDDDHRTRIVCIVRDIDPRKVQELFDAFLGAAAPDQPDHAAVVDNPLVPFGGLDR
jgi:G3E family GTPase